MDKLNLLLLEDVSFDADLIDCALERAGLDFALTVVTDKEGYITAINKQSFDAILSDHSMPQFSGIEALELLKAHGINTPFILVTGTVSEEFAVGVMKEGAADYILKDRLQRLPAAILSAVEKFRMEQALRLQQQATEQKVRESEKRYRQLFENNPFPMLIADTATLRFLDANNAATKHYGYSLDEFRAMSIADLICDEDKQYICNNYSGIAAAMKERQLWRHCRKGHSVIYAEVNIDEVAFGEDMAMLMIIKDVTEKIKVEDELRQSEARLNRSQRIGHIGGWELDLYNLNNLNSNELRWTAETYNIFGLTPGEQRLTSDLFFNMVHPEDRPLIAEAVRCAIDEKKQYSIEHRIIRKDGQERIVHELGEIILDESGEELVKISGTVQDITERKQSEELLQKSEANLRTIFDNTDTGYVLLDASLNVVSFNKPVYKFAADHFSMPASEGISILDYFFGDKKEAASRSLQIALRGMSPTYEVSFPQADGHDKWYYISYHPVWNNEKKILGILLSITDITERKISELQEKKIAADLLQRNKDLEQFAYIISHNLRSPVANIIGVANILSDDDLTNEERKEFMEALIISVKKLDNVITDLNEILQVKHKLHENKERVNFTQIVHDIKYSISNFIENEYVEIVSDFSEIDEMSTLRSYMHSIFYNLISNSIKYRRVDVPPIIEIRSRKHKDAIELTFKDNCMGIDLDKRGEQVFGLYKRFHPHSAEGKGIGLYMVKTQVETLGGKISLTSEVNKGTEFKIVFETPEFFN